MIQKGLFLLLIHFLTLFCALLRIPAIVIGPIKRKKQIRKVVFLDPFFPGNAGYNYRSKKWADLLNKKGMKAQVLHALEEKEFHRLLKKPNLISFHLAFIRKRLPQILKAIWSCDVIIVRRQVLLYNDYGNHFMDKLLLAYFPDAILDFDDDLTNELVNENATSLFGKLAFERPLSFYDRLELYARWMPGSKYLRHLAQSKVNKEHSSLILPSCVDYTNSNPRSYSNKPDTIRLGWIGSNANQMYLDSIVEDINKVFHIHPLELLVVSGEPYSNDKAQFKIVNEQWSLEIEKELIRSMDIGLMPLPDNKRTRGKCGFKIIQYMGLGVIPLASAIGANNEILKDIEGQMLVQPDEDWSKALQNIIEQWSRFPDFSKALRTRIEDKYSFNAHSKKLFEFIAKN